MESHNKTPLWTQDEAIAFECARELIADLISINMQGIHSERAKPEPDEARIEQIKQEITKFGDMRRNLHVDNQVEIARIRAHYGPVVRAWYSKDQAAAAE